MGLAAGPSSHLGTNCLTCMRIVAAFFALLSVVVVLLNQNVNADEFPGLRKALHAYVDVVRNVLVRLCETREFQHITLTETSNALEVC